MDQRQLQIVLKLQDEATKELRKFASGLETTTQKTKQSSEAMDWLAGKAKYMGLAVVAAGIGVAGWGVNVASQLETAKVGMATLLGSTEEATKAVERIKVEAARTPFELPGLTQAVQLLSSVTHDGQESINVILDIGEALAAMGKGQAELDRIIVNLQQVGAIGYASMVDIKQFAYAGIPIFEMLQKETGLAGEALADFISQGGVTFDMLTTMFDKANDKGGQFFNAYKNNAGTFAQVTSNMKDAIGIWSSGMMNASGAQDTLKQGMIAITTELNTYTKAHQDNVRAVNVTAETGKNLFRVFAFITEGIVNTETGIEFLAKAFVNLGSYIAQGISMLNGWDDAEQEAFRNFRTELALSMKEQANFAIDLHLQNQATIEQWGKQADEVANVGEEGEKSYDKLGNAAKDASDKIADANKSIEETKKKIQELQEGFNEDVQKQSQSYGDAVVEQEAKVKDLKVKMHEAEIAEREAADEDAKTKSEKKSRDRAVAAAQQALQDATEEYEREKAALDAKRILYKAFDDEIDEARRRASLTDFERTVEDITRRGGELQKEYDKKKALLEQELADNEAKRAKLGEINKGITADLATQVNAQVQTVHNGVSSIINEWKRLQKANVSDAFTYTNLVSKASARAEGGPVTGGMPYVVGEQGPELFIPSGSGTIIPNGAGGVVVNVYVDGDVSGDELVSKVRYALAMDVKRAIRA